MVTYENRCCDCAQPAYPCTGDGCELRHVRVLLCDKCGGEQSKLYKYNFKQLCRYCLIDEFDTEGEFIDRNGVDDE